MLNDDPRETKIDERNCPSTTHNVKTKRATTEMSRRWKTKTFSESKSSQKLANPASMQRTGAKEKLAFAEELGKENDFALANHQDHARALCQAQNLPKDPFTSIFINGPEAGHPVKGSGRKKKSRKENSQERGRCGGGCLPRTVLHETQELLIETRKKIKDLECQRELEDSISRSFFDKLQQNHEKEVDHLRGEIVKKEALINDLQTFIKNYVDLTYMTSFSTRQAPSSHTRLLPGGGLRLSTPRGDATHPSQSLIGRASVAEELGDSANKMEKKLLALEKMWLNQEKKSLRDINDGGLKKSILLEIKAKELEVKCSCEVLSASGGLEKGITQKILAIDCERLFKI